MFLQLIELHHLYFCLFVCLDIKKVKTTPFCSQAAAKRLCQVAADIPRQLIKSWYLPRKVYLATDGSFCALFTVFIFYDFAACY